MLTKVSLSLIDPSSINFPIINEVIVFATEYEGSRVCALMPFKYFSYVKTPSRMTKKALV